MHIIKIWVLLVTNTHMQFIAYNKLNLMNSHSQKISVGYLKYTPVFSNLLCKNNTKLNKNLRTSLSLPSQNYELFKHFLR